MIPAAPEEKAMSGRSRLRGGDRRKASQKRARPAAPKPVFAGPTWGVGDLVQWQHHTGTYLRAAADQDLAEILIGQRTYRVKKADLRSA
jgi:hypothetical protein